MLPSCDLQQDNPALLLNHDNAYLHYEDDWFIIKSRPDVYNFIFYRGGTTWLVHMPVAFSQSVQALQCMSQAEFLFVHACALLMWAKSACCMCPCAVLPWQG